jgi:adenosylcobyric acid synthase
VHGLFEEDAFRARFLEQVATRRGKRFVAAGVSFAASRRAQFDRLADVFEAHVDMKAVQRLLEEGAPRRGMRGQGVPG